MMFRGGGETWITGSYDPDLNLTYWGDGAGQAVGAGEPRHDRRSTRRCTRAPRSR